MLLKLLNSLKRTDDLSQRRMLEKLPVNFEPALFQPSYVYVPDLEDPTDSTPQTRIVRNHEIADVPPLERIEFSARRQEASI